jgi:hypothetical protein
MRPANVIPIESRRRLFARRRVARTWALLTFALGYLVVLCSFGWWLA